MGTRSTIALEFADGTVGKVYCHWDGYLEHNGQILLEHFSNPFILRDLIDLGDLSSLNPTIGTKHDFDARDLTQCTFYGRDRGETGVDARHYPDFQAYSLSQMEEFNYILRSDGRWYVDQGSGFELLTLELAQVA